MTLIGQIPFRPPAIVPATASMFEVARTMHAGRCGAVVVSADGKSVEAVLSERDIVWGIDRYGIEFMAKKASAYILHAPITCDAGDTVAHAANLMRKHRIRHLPVLRNGALIGIAGALDILRAPDYLDPGHPAAP